MKYLKIIILGLIVLTMTMSSCIKDNFNFDKWDKEVQYEASFAYPAIWGDVAFIDAIDKYDEDGFIIVNDEGYISLVYKVKVKSDDVHDIIYLPNQTVSGNVTGPDFNFAGFNNPGDSVSHTYQIILPFDVFNPDAEIDSILLKAGLFDVSAQSTFHHTTRIYLEFPSVTKNGVPYRHVFTFAYSGDTQSTLNVDFSGYHIDLTQTAQGFNEIPINVRTTLYHSGHSNNAGGLTFNADMRNLEYDIIQGYFGINTLIFESDTLDITLFKSEEFTLEAYSFVDPKFRVYYWNSYGVPSSFYFTELTVNSALDDMDYDIIHYGMGIPMDSTNPYPVSYATVLGTTMEDSLKVTKDNSNIALMIDKRPKWLKFIAHAYTNPLGLTHDNFVTSESLLEAEVIIELPMWGYVYNFWRYDTIEFDMGDIYNEWNPISRALVRVDIQNGFPVETYGQVYFVDNNYVVLDSLFHTYQERLLQPALVDNDGRVIDFARKVTSIEFDLDRLEKIKNTKHVILGGHANTTAAGNQEVVKIYEDYRIIFDVGFEVDVDTEVDLDTIN